MMTIKETIELQGQVEEGERQGSSGSLEVRCEMGRHFELGYGSHRQSVRPSIRSSVCAFDRLDLKCCGEVTTSAGLGGGVGVGVHCVKQMRGVKEQECCTTSSKYLLPNSSSVVAGVHLEGAVGDPQLDGARVGGDSALVDLLPSSQ